METGSLGLCGVMGLVKKEESKMILRFCRLSNSVNNDYIYGDKKQQAESYMWSGGEGVESSSISAW